MNIKVFICAILVATAGCANDTTVDYASTLKSCMTDEDVFLLNEACQTFEMQLINRYHGEEVGQAYRKFLQDIQTMNVPPSFFVSNDSRHMLERIKKSKTFDKIWTKLSSVESYDDIVLVTPAGPQTKPQNEFDPYCIDPNGSYLGCLTKQKTNETVEEYLEATQTAPGISPGLTAGILSENLSDKDFDMGLVRLIIAVGFYYEMGLMFEKV